MAEVEVVVTAAGVKKVVKKVASIDWDETLHPRDKNGKFIKKGSLVALKNGQIAKVTGVTKGVGGKPKLQVEVIGANKVSFPQAASVTAQYQPGDKVKLGVNTGTVTSVVPLKDKTMVTVNLSNGLKVTVNNDQLEHVDPHPPHPASPAADTGAVIGKDQNGEPLHLGDPVVGDDGLDVTIGKVTGVDKAGNVLIDGGPFEPQTVTKKTSPGAPDKGALMDGVPSKDTPPELEDVLKEHVPAPPKLTVDGHYDDPPQVGDPVKSALGTHKGVVTAVHPDNGTIDVNWTYNAPGYGQAQPTVDWKVLKPDVPDAPKSGAVDMTAPPKGVAELPPKGTPVKISYKGKNYLSTVQAASPDGTAAYVGPKYGFIHKDNMEVIGAPQAPAKGVATIPPVGTQVKVNYNGKVATGKITQLAPEDGMAYVETDDGGQLGWIAKTDMEPIGSVANPPVTAPIPIKDKHDAPIGAGDTLKGDNGTTWKVISIKDGVATLINLEGNGAPQDMPASVVSDQMIKTGGTPLSMHGEPIAVGDTVHSAISGANWEVTDIYPDGTVDLKSPSGKTVNVTPANMAHLVKGAGTGPPPLDSHKSYNGYDGQTVHEGDTVYDKKGNAYHVDAIDPGAGTATATGTEGPGKGLTKTLPLAKFQAVTAKSKNATPVALKHGAEVGVTDGSGHPLHVGDTVQKDDYSTGTVTGPSGDSAYYVMVDGKRTDAGTLKRLDGPDPALNPTWHDDVTATDVTGQPIGNGDTVYIPTIDRKATVVGNLPPDYPGETARLIVQDPDDKSNHVVPAGGAEKVTDPSLLYGQKAEDSLPKVKLSGSQEEALDDYTSSGYATVNTELRNYHGDLGSVKRDDGSAVSDQIKRLDAAIKKSASKQPIMVYRGMHHPHPERIKVGTTFRDWGFISTTTDRSVADGFGPNVLMQLPLPPGQHALSIDNNGGGAQGGAEDEILLPRGQAFYTTNVIKTNGRIVIQAKPVDKPTGPVLASANMPVTQPPIEPQEKSAMERYAERLIWEPEDVEIISPPEDPDHEQALTAAGSGRFSGDPAHFFGGDKKFPKGPHLGTWEELKKANPGARETVGHVKPDEVLLASQDHHDRQITATYRAGGDGPHADTPPKVFHHAKTGRKHVVNGHHRILADRIHGRISPVIYLGGVLPGDSGGTAGDSPPAAAAVTGEEFGIKKDIKHAWAEAAHPRDKNGRFIPKGSHVTLGDGSTGQVVGAKVLPGKGKGKDGKPNPGVTMLTVKRDNGTTAVVQADTTVKDPAPIKGVPSTKTRIIHSNPKVPAADLMKSIKDNGGFTYDPKTGGLMVPGKDTGIAVAVPGTEQIVGTGTVSRHQFAKGVQKVVQAHRAQIAQGAKLGGWYSEDRNAYMVELTDVLPGDNRDAAIAEGKKRNQEGIFDIGKGEFIPTGGTGDAHPAEDAAPAPPSAPDTHVPKHAAPDVAPKHAAPDEPPEWTSQDPATWTPRQKEAHDTAGKVISKYAAIEPTVTKQLMDATGGLPSAQLANLDFKLKTQNSLARKLHDKTLDPEKGTIQSYAADIGDALRYTQTSDEAHLAANAKATLAALQQKGWTVKEVGNTWTPGAEYKGINTNLTTPDGQHTFELQFHTPQSLAVKENNHKLYDVARLPETPKPEKERLKAQMVANSAEIAEPAGINTVQMPTTTTPANVDPLGPPTAGGTNTPLIPPGTKLDPGGLMDIAKAQPTPSASPHGVDFRNMTPSQKIAAVATMYGIGSKQYARAVKKWGKKGVGGTVG